LRRRGSIETFHETSLRVIAAGDGVTGCVAGEVDGSVAVGLNDGVECGGIAFAKIKPHCQGKGFGWR